MKGFTLIELMVTVSLVVLLAGFSVANLVGFKDKREAFNEAKFLVEELRKVRTKATAVEIPAGCSGVQAYSLSMSGSSFNTDVVCAVGSVDNYITNSLGQAVFAADYVVAFDTYGRTGEEVVIDICLGGAGYRVRVSAEGVIGQPEESVGVC